MLTIVNRYATSLSPICHLYSDSTWQRNHAARPILDGLLIRSLLIGGIPLLLWGWEWLGDNYDIPIKSKLLIILPPTWLFLNSGHAHHDKLFAKAAHKKI